MLVNFSTILNSFICHIREVKNANNDITENKLYRSDFVLVCLTTWNLHYFLNSCLFCYTDWTQALLSFRFSLCISTNAFFAFCLLHYRLQSISRTNAIQVSPTWKKNFTLLRKHQWIHENLFECCWNTQAVPLCCFS